MTSPLLYEAADDAEAIVDGSLGLFDHQFVRPAHNDAHGLSWVSNASDLGENMHRNIQVNNSNLKKKKNSE